MGGCWPTIHPCLLLSDRHTCLSSMNKSAIDTCAMLQDLSIQPCMQKFTLTLQHCLPHLVLTAGP